MLLLAAWRTVFCVKNSCAVCKVLTLTGHVWWVLSAS